MGIKFPGEILPPIKPDLETIESFGNAPVGGVEKFSEVSTAVVSIAQVVLKNQLDGWTGGSNVTTDRAFDANSTTTDELADVLGTLIADLKAVELLKA